MTVPPDYAIECARQAALKSPCVKSKRGVVLYDVDPKYGRDGLVAIAAEGFNGQPEPFGCAASEACRRDCAKLCLHAEERAIRQALIEWGSPEDMRTLELVHVKVVDGQVVPGGGPSCWQCSRLVVEVGLRGVWLYEQHGVDPATSKRIAAWRFYPSVEFHHETLRACGIEATP